MTTEKLIGQETMIREVLQDIPAAREDDYILFAEVLERFYPEIAQMPFKQALQMHTVTPVPSYESFARVRRKVQRKYPELASDKARRKREQLEAEYRKYAEEWD